MATGIVILNYNGAQDTVQCIQSIEKFNSAPVKLLVIDNGSSNGEDVDCLDNFFTQTGRPYLRLTDNEQPENPLPYFTLLASTQNSGYAQGNNKGLRLAFADPEIDQVLILNNDVLFTEDILPALLEIQDQLPNAGLITPLIVSRNGEIDHCCAREFPSNREVMLPFMLFKRDLFHILSKSNQREKILLQHPDWVQKRFFPVGMPSGACMLIDKALLQEAGGFEDGTFLYYEENILCKKLQDRRKCCYCIPSISALHLGGSSTSKTQNLFLQKCNLESADYYLRHFAGMTFFQCCIWTVTCWLWKLKFHLKQR